MWLAAPWWLTCEKYILSSELYQHFVLQSCFLLRLNNATFSCSLCINRVREWTLIDFYFDLAFSGLWAQWRIFSPTAYYCSLQYIKFLTPHWYCFGAYTEQPRNGSWLWSRHHHYDDVPLMRQWFVNLACLCPWLLVLSGKLDPLWSLSQHQPLRLL